MDQKRALIWDNELSTQPYVALFEGSWDGAAKDRFNTFWRDYCSASFNKVIAGRLYGQRVSKSQSLRDGAVFANALARKAAIFVEKAVMEGIVTEQTNNLRDSGEIPTTQKGGSP